MNLEPLNITKFPGHSINDVLIEIVNEINDIKEVLLEDETMRRNSPALQDAWEQYQTIKKFVK